jgi:hypothetical protein
MTKKRIPPTTTNSNIGRNPFQKNVELTVFLRFPSIFTILCLGIGNNTYLINRVSVFSPPPYIQDGAQKDTKEERWKNSN